MERISIEVIDTAFLGELLDGDHEFGRELLDTFLDSSSNCISEARSLLESGAPAVEASRPFHTLKGAAVSVGLVRVHALARELEKRFEPEGPGVEPADLSHLEREIEKGRQALLAFLEDAP